MHTAQQTSGSAAPFPATSGIRSCGGISRDLAWASSEVDTSFRVNPVARKKSIDSYQAIVQGTAELCDCQLPISAFDTKNSHLCIEIGGGPKLAPSTLAAIQGHQVWLSKYRGNVVDIYDGLRLGARLAIWVFCMADLQANRGPQLVGVSAGFLALTWLVVMMRCYVRLSLTNAGFRADDWCMVVSVVIFTLIAIFTFLGVHYGLGKHNAALSIEDQVEALKYQALATIV
ncbi:MAG: hypothetical protein M1818_004514 [Claussenomyces sp. TS43310]|nr:MAG: hypothetical protein M1818_004514 [Claussenomyces sp. TS43310]